MNFEKLYKEIIKSVSDETHGSLYYRIDSIPKEEAIDHWYVKDLNGIKTLPFDYDEKDDIDSLIRNDMYIVRYYDSHGMDGGNCWGSEASGYHNEMPEDFHFDDLATELCLKFCPDISFLKYKTLLNGCIMEFEKHRSEYYGNYSVNKYKVLNLKTFAEKLLPNLQSLT